MNGYQRIIAEQREEIERHRAGHAETQANALAWMRAHDAIASWIQQDLATLKRWIEHPPPNHKLPKPADLPEMLKEQRENIERLRTELAEYERKLRECHASIAAMRRRKLPPPPDDPDPASP